MSNTPSLRELEHHGAFLERHIGPNDAEIAHMLRVVGHDSLDAMTDAIVPASIKSAQPLALPAPINEEEALANELEQMPDEIDEGQRLVQTQLALICRQLGPLRTLAAHLIKETGAA